MSRLLSQGKSKGSLYSRGVKANHCLFCDHRLEDGRNLSELLFSNSLLCGNCLHQLKRYSLKIHLEDYPIEVLYEYNDFMAQLLVQYKDFHDEALSPIFLSQDLSRLRVKYRHYQLIPMPSSEKKIKERGFKHVNQMFEYLNLPIVDCLAKKNELKQVQSNYQQREKMMNNICLSKPLALNKKILLVDDVMTTGATLKGALKALNYPKNLKILVVAKTKLE